MNISTPKAACLLLGITLLATNAYPADIDPATNPFASTHDQVRARFLRIEQEVTRLYHAGSPAEAQAMNDQLTHFKRELTGLEPSALQSLELDWIGVYEANSSISPPPERVTVNLLQTGRPIVLALSSYYPVPWDVQMEDGVKLQKVIVWAESNPTQPMNVPAGVPVEVYTSHTMPSGCLPPYRVDTERYPRAARDLQKLAGVDLASYQGIYTYSTPFQIGGTNSEWAEQRILHEMQPLYDQATSYERTQQRAAAAKLTFSAFLSTPAPDGFSTRQSIAQFTPLGIVPGTTKDLSTGLHYFALDGSGYVYGADSQDVYRINLSDLSKTHVGPTLNWICGLAFDTKRNRLVISDLTSQGTLYTYSPAQKQWSTLSGLNGIDLQALTYSPADDSYYGLTIPATDDSMIEVCRFDSAGALVDRFAPSRPIPRRSEQLFESDYQLIAVGDLLQVITPALPDVYHPDRPDQPWSMLLDPHTGQVTYMDMLTIPEPAAPLASLAPALLLLRRRR